MAILAMDINGEDEKRVWLSEFTRDNAQLAAALNRAPHFVDVEPAVADARAGKMNQKNDADRGSSLTLGGEAPKPKSRKRRRMVPFAIVQLTGNPMTTSPRSKLSKEKTGPLSRAPRAKMVLLTLSE